MRNTSTAYNQLLTNPYEMRPWVDIDLLADGVPVASFQNVPVSAGQITQDRGSAVRGRMTVTISDPTGELVPTSATDLFDERFGVELAPRVGLQLPDGTVETFPWGVYMITSTNSQRQPEGVSFEVEAFDRSELVRRNEFSDRYTIASDTPVVDAIVGIVADRLTFAVDKAITAPTSETTNRVSYGSGDDPWKACMDLAAGAGFECFFNLAGQLVVQPLPTAAPTAVVFDHQANPTLLSKVSAPVDARDRPNSVTIVGDSSYLLFPVRGTVEDTDPASPTWVGSRRGRIPRTIRSSSVFSTAKAEQIAREHFDSLRNGGRNYSWTQLPDFALEPGDVVRLFDEPLGIDQPVIVETATVPLTINPMELVGTTRIAV